MGKRYLLFMMIVFACNKIPEKGKDHSAYINQYNIEWDTQSKDATGSMPLGGGNLGLNVWVEDDDVLFYIGHPDSRLENQKLIKLGRVRLSFSPSPFSGKFSQQLNLQESSVSIKGETVHGKPLNLKLWVDAFNPVVHAELISAEPVEVTVAYESWFFESLEILNGLEWRYRLDPSKSDLPGKIENQKLEPIAKMIQNPLLNLTIGGRIVADGLVYLGTDSAVYMNTPFKAWKTKTAKPVNDLDIRVLLRVAQEESLEDWKRNLDALEEKTKISSESDYSGTVEWWKQFWDRSYISINPDKDRKDTAWQVGRNYQLFRYMLGCNRTGTSPTLFNGGIFTFDNPLKDFGAFGAKSPNPDERAWWETMFMAQNQRLVYWPMIRAGDFDLLEVGLNFYRDRANLQQARARSLNGYRRYTF